MELYEAQEYTVRPMLRAVAGVADVNSNGGLEEQFVVQPDPVRLKMHGVTAGELAEAVGRNTENAGGGIIRRGAERFTVRTEARVTSAEAIAAIPVKFAGGILPLTVRDLATVTTGAAPRQGAATQNGRETVLGTVMMLVGQNSREVARRVEDALPGVEAALPKGMAIDRQYSRADLVDRTIQTVDKNLGEGALLVALVLLFVMGKWRAALIVALVIPLAFLVTTGGVHALGVSGNLMSLGALDFGLIVDGAIVVVENSLRLLGQRRREKGEDLTADERRKVVADAARMVARPTLFGIAIIALVYVPVLSLGGVEGKLFQPMAQAVMLAIVAGLIWTFTVVPALSAWLLRAPATNEGEHKGGFVGVASRVYTPALDRAIAHPLILVLAALALLAGTFMVFRTLGSQFTPQLDEGSITAMVYRPVGMSLERSLAIEQATERAIRRAYPQVTRTFSRIGTSEVATDPMPPEQNDLYVFYAPEKDWPTGAGTPRNKDELIAGIEKVARRVYPKQNLEFAQPIEMRFNEMLEGRARRRGGQDLWRRLRHARARSGQGEGGARKAARHRRGRVRNRRPAQEPRRRARPPCAPPPRPRHTGSEQCDPRRAGGSGSGLHPARPGAPRDRHPHAREPARRPVRHPRAAAARRRLRHGPAVARRAVAPGADRGTDPARRHQPACGADGQPVDQ